MNMPFVRLQFSAEPNCSPVHVCFLSLLVLIGMSSAARAQIPPKPQGGQFIHDRAATISEADKDTLLRLQQDVFAEAEIPIVVVTINRMSDYLPGTPTIERTARTWFDSWGIGSQQNNNGILVLISKGDRKGRIELGQAWGHRFDSHCKRVMDKNMIPYFKQGDYGGGIVAGVDKLADMAKSGPQSQPPEPGIMDTVQDYGRVATQNNPVAQFAGEWLVIALAFGGICCLAAAYFLPDQRKVLVFAGILLLALAFVFWLVIILVVLSSLRHLNGDSSGGYRSQGGFNRGYSSGGGFGGGGFGGGSSGGGGTSGSW